MVARVENGQIIINIKGNSGLFLGMLHLTFWQLPALQSLQAQRPRGCWKMSENVRFCSPAVVSSSGSGRALDIQRLHAIPLAHLGSVAFKGLSPRTCRKSQVMPGLKSFSAQS